VQPGNGESGNDRFGNPNSIAFDSQGNIYVSDGGDWWTGDNGNHRIQVFDSAGNYKATLGTTETPGTGNYQFHGPAHIAIYNDYLYVADRGNHRVQIYQITFSPSFTMTYVATLGKTDVAGDDNDHFDNPSGVAVDASYIYVADTFNHRVQVFNRSSRTYVTTIGGYGSGNGQFDQPYDVAVDASGYLYVADFENSRVQQFRPAGGTTWNWWLQYGVTGVPYVTDGWHYNDPEGVAVAADGSIYIAENYGRRLVKLSADGTPQWAKPDIPGVIGYSPNDVAVGQDSRVYLAAGWEDRIRIYNPDGTLYASFGGYGNGNYQFADPQGLGVAPNGDIYVADCGNHRIQIYRPDWSYKATLGVNGQAGSDNAHFDCPRDVAIDGIGTIYVADEGNHRVQVFDSNRNYVRTIGITGTTGNGFDRFSDWGLDRLAVDSQNRVYITDGGNNRVQVFDSTGAYLTTIGGSWGMRTGQLRGPSGIAIGPDGSLYVADSDNHRIQKFAPGVPGWKQVNINGFGDPANKINSLGAFGGYLYAATYTFRDHGAQLWRTADGLNWTAVMTNGFGVYYNVGIDHLVEFNGKLYAGVWNSTPNPPYTDTGGEIWRSSDGTTWEPVVQGGFGDRYNGKVMHMAVFNNQIYAGTWSYTSTHGAEIWRSSTGNSNDWQQVVSNGFGDASNEAIMDMVEFNGALYAGTRFGAAGNGADLWRSTDGLNWTPVITDGFGYTGTYDIAALAAFQNHLYAGTGRYDFSAKTYPGGQVWRCSQSSNCDEASDWELVVSDGFGNPDNINVSALHVFDGYLYAIPYNFRTGLEVWRTKDGTNWEQVGLAGLGDSNNSGTYWNNSIATFNNRLFIGTTNGANGGEVWKKTVTADFTASPTVGSPGTTVTFTNLSGGDVVTSTWNFGDGSPSLTVTHTDPVTHTYTTPGVYTVTLTVEDGVDTDVRTRTAYIQIAHRIFLPLVLRAYNPLIALYDDFNNPAFDGFYNPLKWRFWGDENYFTMRQQEGVMVLTSTNAPAERDTVMVASMPLERTLRQVQRFQARLKISPDTMGTGAKIQIMAEDIGRTGRNWWASCDLTRYGSNAYFGCSISSSDGNEYHTGGPAQVDRWYTARIEIDPTTARICFYQDEVSLGCHTPADANALKAATNLTARIGAWNGNANPSGTLYFDDVSITPAR
jgi:PKD repeat protein